MKSHLTVHGYWQYVCQPLSSPSDTKNPSWAVESDKALEFIKAYLGPIVSLTIETKDNLTSPKEVWEYLGTKYDHVDDAAISSMEKELGQLTLSDPLDIETHLDKFNLLIANLARAKVTWVTDDNVLRRKLLSTFDTSSDEIRTLKLIIESRPAEEKSFDKVVAYLTHHFLDVQQDGDRTHSNFLLRGEPKTKETTEQVCKNCSKSGHLIGNCWSRGGGKEGGRSYINKGRRKGKKPQGGAKGGAKGPAAHVAGTPNCEEDPFAWAAYLEHPSDSYRNDPIGDTSATHSIFHSPLSEYWPSRTRVVQTAKKGVSIPTRGEGSITLTGGVKNFKLSHILHAPDIVFRSSKLSTRATPLFSREGGKIIKEPDCPSLKNMESFLIGRRDGFWRVGKTNPP